MKTGCGAFSYGIYDSLESYVELRY
jgi:hypothetical protein